MHCPSVPSGLAPAAHGAHDIRRRRYQGSDDQAHDKFMRRISRIQATLRRRKQPSSGTEDTQPFPISIDGRGSVIQTESGDGSRVPRMLGTLMEAITGFQFVTGAPVSHSHVMTPPGRKVVTYNFQRMHVSKLPSV